ncbi:MAG TPA: hypothetical protein VK463_07990 [Desulfomonilaceae bacterium]|nr:hypothetical protein [Desulfomonilaceae bacterium]
MILKILTSAWFASLVVAVATLSLYLLYSSGQATEAAVGGGILVVAVILILVGSRNNSSRE